MSTSTRNDVNAEQISRIQQHISSVAELDAKEICYRTELGEINFDSMVSDVAYAIDLAKVSSNLPFERLPRGALQTLEHQFSNIQGQLKRLGEFRLAGNSNPTESRAQLINTVPKNLDAAAVEILPIVGFLLADHGEIKKKQLEIEAIAGRMEAELERSRKRAEDARSQLDNMLEAARATTARTGVATHSTDFKKLTSSHERYSKYWLVSTIILFAVTAVLPYVLLVEFASMSVAQKSLMIPFLASRVIIVSIMYIALIWSARNYRAHRHLAVINQHKATALDTFKSFVEGSEDPQTRNNVLLEATHCVFGPMQTGYLGPDEDSGGNRIVEILKTVAPISKS